MIIWNIIKKVIVYKPSNFSTEKLDEEIFETRDMTEKEERLYNTLLKIKNKFDVDTSLKKVPDFFKK